MSPQRAYRANEGHRWTRFDSALCALCGKQFPDVFRVSGCACRQANRSCSTRPTSRLGSIQSLPEHLRHAVRISAKQETGIDDLIRAIHRVVRSDGFLTGRSRGIHGSATNARRATGWRQVPEVRLPPASATSCTVPSCSLLPSRLWFVIAFAADGSSCAGLPSSAQE